MDTSKQNNIENLEKNQKEIDQILQCANSVYKSLGPGHNERIYHKAMVYELNCYNLNIDTEMNIVVKYTDSKGHTHHLETERIDIFIHTYDVILELKATQKDIQVQEKCQLNKYFNELKKIDKKVNYGIIINFRQPNSKEIPKNIDSFIEFIN